MRSTQVINGSINTTAVISTTYVPRERPDQYGMVSVRHGGSKIASGGTFKGTIEGSIDNTNWFVMDVLKVDDAEYAATSGEVDTSNPLNSWNKVVPLAPYMRVRIINGGGNLFNVWISE